MSMFIVALFTTAKLEKQPRSPTMVNGLRKCDIHTCAQWSIIGHKDK
jgi:hypothetical protein